MINKQENRIFNIDNFIYFSLVIMVLNSIGLIRFNQKSQILSVVLSAFFGITILFSLIKGNFKLDFKAYKLQYIIVLASLLSLLTNSFLFISKNVYSLVAVISNFIIFFSITRDENYKERLYKFLKLLVCVLFVINLINFFMLFFNLDIRIDTDVFMGVDKLRGRFNGLSGNPNGLSRVGLSGIIASSLYYIYSHEKSKRILISSLLLHSYIILVSQSRGTILALFVGVLVSASLLWLKDNGLPRKLQIAFFIISILLGSWFTLEYYMKIASIVVNNIPVYIFEEYEVDGELGGGSHIDSDGKSPKKGGIDSNRNIIDRMDRDAQRLDDDISNGRLSLIKNGINATRSKNLLFGLSYGGNKKQVQDYLDSQNKDFPYFLYNQAGSMHNTIVQFLVNVGLFGLIPFLIFLFNFIFTWIKETIFNRDVVVSNEMLIMCFMATSLFVLNMVEWVFYFDFDNHLVNFFQMLVYGWTFFRLSGRVEV